MITDRQRHARFQSDFYKEHYHKILRSLLIMSVIILLLVMGILYFILFPDSPKYYATTTNGQIIPLVAVSGGT